MIDWRGRVATQARVEEQQPINAPLFRTLVQGLEDRERCVVLDMGAAATQTIALFSRYPCRLDIADLADGINNLNGLDDDAALRRAAEAMLPVRHTEPTDIVLCWDVLNYMNRRALGAIMASVAERARVGTLVHALIVYSENQMPPSPGQFTPTADFSLTSLHANGALREAPRYTPDDLKRSMNGYHIERAMLLGNGMQEFLFRL